MGVKMRKTKAVVPLEWEEQAAVIRWAEFVSCVVPELSLLQGSMNGVRLTTGQAVKAKKTGLKKGFPDLFLPVARKGYHGLMIELKRRSGGIVSKEQKEVLSELCKQGYFAVVCEGSDEAIAAIKNYLDIK